MPRTRNGRCRLRVHQATSRRNDPAFCILECAQARSRHASSLAVDRTTVWLLVSRRPNHLVIESGWPPDPSADPQLVARERARAVRLAPSVSSLRVLKLPLRLLQWSGEYQPIQFSEETTGKPLFTVLSSVTSLLSSPRGCFKDLDVHYNVSNSISSSPMWPVHGLYAARRRATNVVPDIMLADTP